MRAIDRREIRERLARGDAPSADEVLGGDLDAGDFRRAH
jgi:hypothetical protein